jgi:alkyl hydroperoxide reductase subunit D
MSIETLKNSLPDYAKDIRLNLSSLAMDDTLTAQQLWGTFVASALSTGNQTVIDAVMAEAAPQLSPEALNAAKAAHAVMAMNNIYYRFVHMASNAEYKTMPAKLRMNVIGKPGVDKADFELWSLAVSAMNGCGMCIDSHEATLRQHGISGVQIQTAVRIAAVMNAVASVLTSESTHSLAQAA